MFTYISGDKARYTGETEEMHGEKFYLVEMLEGQHKGKIRYTATSPSGSNALSDQKKRDWKDQQDDFRRLREFDQGA